MHIFIIYSIIENGCLAPRSDSVGVGLQIHLHHNVASSVCWWLLRTMKLCPSSGSVGVGLQIHLDHKVASSLCLGLFRNVSCAREVTMLEMACKYILIIRLRQVCDWGCSETKVCSSSDSVGVGLQIHLDHKVASSMCLGLFRN